MANLIAWAKKVVGRYIDVDQWEGNQCWDLSQAWLTACNGGTLWTQPSRYPGLAAGSWDVATGNTANTADLLRYVTPIPGTERGLPGDIIIWAYGSPDYPISHTAVLIEDRGPILNTLSQNSSPARPDLPGYSVKSSGPVIYQDLPRAGILGFLRPRATITGLSSGITPIQEDDMSAADVTAITTSVDFAFNRLLTELPGLIADAVLTKQVPHKDPATGKDDGQTTSLATMAGFADFQATATRDTVASAARAMVDAVVAAPGPDAAAAAEAAYDAFLTKLDGVTIKVGTK